VQELLDQIDEDLVRLDEIESRYGSHSNAYTGTVNRIRNRYYLAESLAAQLPTEDEDLGVKTPVRLNGIDMAVKSQDPEFVSWASEQLRLAELWEWDR